MHLAAAVTLLVPPEKLIGLRAAVSEAGHGVDEDERDQRDHQHHVRLPPLPAQVGQQPGLAGRAGVAERRLVVAPQRAVDAGERADGADPVRRVHERVPARRRRLAAPGLRARKVLYQPC